MAQTYLTVDTSELNGRLEMLRGMMRPSSFYRLVNRTFGEVGRRSKTLIAKETAKKYDVTQKWVKSQIMPYKLNTANGVSCVIPLRGHRGSIGGTFKASGKSVISASIVKGHKSRMPSVMSHQGGGKPFMMKMKNGYKIAKVRTDRNRLATVVGLSVPQMPLNQAADGVQNEILDLAWKRLEHNYNNMIQRGQL